MFSAIRFVIRFLFCVGPLLIIVSCNGTLNSPEASSDDDDEFSSSAPAQISGTFLTYENTSGVRCKYSVTPGGYESKCHIVAKVWSFEVKPAGISKGVDVHWKNPAVLQGKNISEISCRVSQSGVEQVCDIIMPKVHAEFDFAASVSGSDRSENKKPSFKLLLPYSAHLKAGFNLNLPYSEAGSHEFSGDSLAFNFKEVSAFSGRAYVRDVCTVDQTIYYADKIGVYRVKNGKVKTFLNGYNTNPSLYQVSQKLRACQKNGCDIKIACDAEGMYIAENETKALFHIDKKLNASEISISAVLKRVPAPAVFYYIELALGPSGDFYVSIQEPAGKRSIYKKELERLVHYAGGGSQLLSRSGISPDDLLKADLKDSSFGAISSLHFDSNGKLNFLGSSYTQWMIDGGVPYLVKTSKSGLWYNFRDKYAHSFRPHIVLPAKNRTFYTQFFIQSDDQDARSRLSWDRPGGPYIDASQHPVLKNFMGSTAVQLRKFGDDILMFNANRGILKISYEPELKFEYMVGTPSSDIGTPNEDGEFKKQFIEEARGAKETKIYELVDMKRLNDGSIVYLDEKLGLVKKVGINGEADLLAGGGSKGFLSSGSAKDLFLDSPSDIVVRSDGTILIKDKTRIISIKDGFFHTVAGQNSESGEYASKPCSNDKVSPIGADFGAFSGMAVDPKTDNLYWLTGVKASIWAPVIDWCIQKLTVGGDLTTVAHSRDFNEPSSPRWEKFRPIYSALTISPKNKIMFVESLVDKAKNPIFNDRTLLPAKVLSFDLSSPHPKVESEMDLEVENETKIASLDFGPNDEIFILNSHARSLSAYGKNLRGEYQKTTLFSGEDQVVCSAGNLAGTSSSSVFVKALSASLSGVCRGIPLKIVVSDTCSENDGKVSLVYAQMFNNPNNQAYSLVGGANIYRVEWPCSAKLFED